MHTGCAMTSTRRNVEKTRYALPDYEHDQAPLSQTPQTQTQHPRFLVVSAADFVALPLSGRAAANPTVLGPLESAARPPSYNLGGGKENGHLESLGLKVGRRPVSERPRGSELWAKEPFLIQDTAHSDRVSEIVQCAAAVAMANSCMKAPELGKGYLPPGCAVFKPSPVEKRFRRASTGRLKSAPPTSLNAPPADTMSRPTLSPEKHVTRAHQQPRVQFVQGSDRRTSAPPSIFRPICLSKNPTSNNSPCAESTADETASRMSEKRSSKKTSAPTLVVPAYSPKEVILNVPLTERAGESKNQIRCALNRRAAHDALYDLDAWSDAVDTIGTETWNELVQPSTQIALSPQCDDKSIPTKTSEASWASSPTEHVTSSSYVDDGSPRSRLSRHEPESSTNRKLNTDYAPKFNTDTAITQSLYFNSEEPNRSDVFVENKTLRGLLDANEVVRVGGTCLPTCPSGSSIDLDFKFQDVEDEGAQRSITESSSSQTPRVVCVEDKSSCLPVDMASTQSGGNFHDAGELKAVVFSESNVPSFFPTRSIVDRRPVGARYMYLVPPGTDGERRSEGDNILCGSPRMVPCSPTTDAEDGKRSPSNASSSSSSRRLFGLTTTRISDESDDQNSLPSSSFYANDEYDKFCQRNDSPLRPKRNSYLNRILTGEVRERTKSRSSNAGSSSS